MQGDFLVLEENYKKSKKLVLFFIFLVMIFILVVILDWDLDFLIGNLLRFICYQNGYFFENFFFSFNRQEIRLKFGFGVVAVVFFSLFIEVQFGQWALFLFRGVFYQEGLGILGSLQRFRVEFYSVFGFQELSNENGIW